MVTLGDIRGLIMDMDGVLWRGNENLSGVAEFFAILRARGVRFVLATNNAARTPEYYVARLKGIGVNIEAKDVLTSSLATARYLRHLNSNGARVFIVGEEGLVQALREAGFEPVDRGAQYVIVGLDRELTYEKLKRATLEIRSGALFVATNPDKTLPTDEGLVPGAGSILAAIQTASGKPPDIIIGKPSRTIFDLAVEMLGLPRKQVAIVGDRLDTDIEGARAADLHTILVLTGITTRAELQNTSIKPDWVVDDLTALLAAWN